ncbi:hypothetical protein GCM10023100_23570 [Actinocorallia cavernae]|uniref:Uncharacterized protein n=2 Tax=Actinomycetes TaxID=1760 RepID=A0ABN3LXI3_9ACTN
MRDSPTARKAWEVPPDSQGALAAGVACTGPGSRPPFAGSSETFGFFQAKGAARVCLHSYSDFLLSETADPLEPL